MKDDRVFVDTNILVYAYDSSAGKKHIVSKEIIKDLWNSARGVMSTQVLQEFFVSTTRKIPKPLDAATAKSVVKDYLKWKTVVIDGETILEAIDIQGEYKYSFWDSLIVASALRSGAATLLSEDFTDAHKIKGIRIKNPFVGGG